MADEMILSMMTYRQRMSWLASEIRKRISNVKVTAAAGDKAANLLKVTAGLVKCCIEQVEALSVLLDAEKFDGAFVVQRAIWEYWKEFEHLIDRPSPEDDAVRLEANTILDVLAAIRSSRKPHDDAVADTEAWLERLEAQFPEIVSEMKNRKKRGHWSGKRRSQIFAPKGPQSVVYRALSWQSHPELAVFREIRVTVGDKAATLQIVRDEFDAHDVAEKAARGATDMLWRLWERFADYWQLERFALPEAAAGCRRDQR